MRCGKKKQKKKYADAADAVMTECMPLPFFFLVQLQVESIPVSFAIWRCDAAD